MIPQSMALPTSSQSLAGMEVFITSFLTMRLQPFPPEEPFRPITAKASLMHQCVWANAHKQAYEVSYDISALCYHCLFRLL